MEWFSAIIFWLHVPSRNCAKHVQRALPAVTITKLNVLYSDTTNGTKRAEDSHITIFPYLKHFHQTLSTGESSKRAREFTRHHLPKMFSTPSSTELKKIISRPSSSKVFKPMRTYWDLENSHITSSQNTTQLNSLTQPNLKTTLIATYHNNALDWPC